MDDGFQQRNVSIPTQKIGFFKRNWMQIYTPLVDLFDLQVRFNLQTKSIDLRTKTPANLERCAQFITALLYNFPIESALLILKKPDVFIDSFKIKDVKKLKNDHVGRAIGRIVGREGKIKKAIETSSNSKIVINGDEITIMGSVDNVRIARDSVCRLIMGSDPSKVCNGLRNVTGKIKDRIGMVESIKDRLE